jgi:hypothetical protein
MLAPLNFLQIVSWLIKVSQDVTPTCMPTQFLA